MKHKIKIDLEHANHYLNDVAPWLLRKNDGIYKTGDTIELIAVDDKKKILFSFDAVVTKVTRDIMLGLQTGWCILCLEPFEEKYYVELGGTELQKSKLKRKYQYLEHVSQ